ncbi:MAG: class I adenylate cyclase [Methylophagaceae bacterium]
MDDTQIIAIFQTLNRERIERLGSLLPVKHQNILHFIPLLFQVNSNVLPGYINLETPIGIVDYQPNKQAVDAAKNHHKTFSYARRALHRYPIRAIYLINKNGMLNYNSNEPFELWLIYAQPISKAQVTLLKQKSVVISTWMKKEGIPLNIRLFDEAKLASNNLSSYDLDLLYCSSLLLAGNAPSWWTKNVDQRAQTYALRYARESINFGESPRLSEQALFDLASANIKKSLHNGIESCLDLLYFDCLLKNHAKVDSFSLSHILKQAVIDGETDPMLLDINSLKYKFIHQYTSDSSILALAQQSIYLKSKELLSKKIAQASYPWRREFIKNQIEDWQWQDNTSEQLDQVWQLHYRQSRSLFQLVRTQLTDSLTTLADFSQQHKLDTSQTRLQLQQKFDVLFHDQADTLNQLPLAFFPRQAEEYAYLYRKKNSHIWCVDDRALTISKTPLYKHSSLLNVLAWAVNNHLISKATRLKIADKNHTVNSNVIIELVQHLLRSSLSNKPISFNNVQLDKTAQIKHVLLFANVDEKESGSLSPHGLEISSLQDDPFSYANKKQNLVFNIEGLIHSSRGQWHYFIFKGNNCLLQMLTAILLWHPTKPSASKTSCWCHYGNHGQNISSRIEKSYHQVLNHYLAHPIKGEYLVSLGETLYQLKWQDDLCDSSPLPKNTSVLQHLTQNRLDFYPSTIDPMLDDEGLLSTILNYQAPDQINLFILTIDSQLIVYILDDVGSLFKQQFSNLTQNTLTNHFHEFLTAIPDSGNIIPKHFFHISKQYQSEYKVTEFPLKKISVKLHHLPVTVEMESPEENSKCTIYCGAKKLSGPANEPDLFIQVRDLLLSLRKSNNDYHLYITQLTFKQPNVPICDYLVQKQRLEYLLNKL